MAHELFSSGPVRKLIQTMQKVKKKAVQCLMVRFIQPLSFLQSLQYQFFHESAMLRTSHAKILFLTRNLHFAINTFFGKMLVGRGHIFYFLKQVEVQNIN